jgi:hypothetical protein
MAAFVAVVQDGDRSRRAGRVGLRAGNSFQEDLSNGGHDSGIHQRLEGAVPFARSFAGMVSMRWKRRSIRRIKH